MEQAQQNSSLEKEVDRLNFRFDRHLEIYAQNGKELAALKSSIESLKSSVDKTEGRGQQQDGTFQHELEKTKTSIGKLEIKVDRITTKIAVYASLGSAIASATTTGLITILL